MDNNDFSELDVDTLKSNDFVDFMLNLGIL